ncbi:hypothetical protein B0H11DRAFT_2286268 [Mycena galericulata]|nr:hypothetical protein B0H11DRAFT_2286268 [Mycena galericulata]
MDKDPRPPVLQQILLHIRFSRQRAIYVYWSERLRRHCADLSVHFDRHSCRPLGSSDVIRKRGLSVLPIRTLPRSAIESQGIEMKMKTDEILSRLGHAVDEARQHIGQLEQELVGAREENGTLSESSGSSRMNRLELSYSALQEELATVKQGRDHSCWHCDTSAYVVQQKCDELEAQVKQRTEVLSSVGQHSQDTLHQLKLVREVEQTKDEMDKNQFEESSECDSRGGKFLRCTCRDLTADLASLRAMYEDMRAEKDLLQEVVSQACEQAVQLVEHIRTDATTTTAAVEQGDDNGASEMEAVESTQQADTDAGKDVNNDHQSDTGSVDLTDEANTEKYAALSTPAETRQANGTHASESGVTYLTPASSQSSAPLTLPPLHCYEDEESDLRAEQLQASLRAAEVKLLRWDELLLAKEDLEKRLEESLTKVMEKEELIQQLTDDLVRQTTQLEAQRKTLEAATVHNQEDTTMIMALRNEVKDLREQLNRSNALNGFTRATGSRTDPPLSPTFTPALPVAEQNGTATRITIGGRTQRRQRRRSSAGVFALAPSDHRTSTDEIMIDVMQDHALNPRAISAAYSGDSAEEKIILMQDAKRLDQDVLNGLVRGLKIPAPSLTNPSPVKEILFPANLILLVTHEMWKYGLIPESERFLANVMQTIQEHVMSFTGEEAIVPGIFWLSNVHEMLSFISAVESDLHQGIGPGEENAVRPRPFDWNDYERLVAVLKYDLDSLEYNIYHAWMLETKNKLSRMVIPALIESQSLPGFTMSDSGGPLFNRLLDANNAPAYSMDDMLNVLNKVWESLKSYYMEESVVKLVVTELLKIIGVTSFNDLLMRHNFSSWRRGQYWSIFPPFFTWPKLDQLCKSNTTSLESKSGASLTTCLRALSNWNTKLLQLKKTTAADIDIIYDVCWMLSPMQIQRMCTNYYVADYENPISPEILKVVASRVEANDRNDHLLLSPETDEVGPYELPLPREVSVLEAYVPAYLNVSHLRRLAALVSYT